MDKQKYLDELSKLLGFMSSWDKHAAMRKYTDLLDLADDPQQAMETLGTPTAVAVRLAHDYVPSPPPVGQPPEEPELLTMNMEPFSPENKPSAPALEPPPPNPSAHPLPPKKKSLSSKNTGPALTLWRIFAILIGIPVGIALFCLGLPFLAAGAYLAYTVVQNILPILPAFTLVSDILLVSGIALLALSIALSLVWTGAFLCIELPSLWANRCVFALGARIQRNQEVSPP